jgi:lipase
VKTLRANLVELTPGEAKVAIVHASGFASACYGPLAEAMDVPAVGVDLPGHGTAPDDPPPGAVADWLVLADALGAALGPEPQRLVVIGHSLGATVALLAAAAGMLHPIAIAAFEPVLIDPADADHRAAQHALAEGALRRREHFADRAEARARLAAKPPMANFDARVVEAYLHACLVPDRAHGGLRLRCSPALEAAIYRGGSETGARERLGAVRVPLLIAVGAASDTLPPQELSTLALGPRARTTVVEGVGHFGPFERPDAVAAALGPWVRTHLDAVLHG